jgi:hypothetical protein
MCSIVQRYKTRVFLMDTPIVCWPFLHSTLHEAPSAVFKLESRSIWIKLFFAGRLLPLGMNKVGVASYQTASNRWS